MSDSVHASENAGSGVLVNDVHSQLNATVVREVTRVTDAAEVRACVDRARRDGLAISIAGGRHAMGGQQFATGSILIDTTSMNRIIELDGARGIVEVQAGIFWSALIDGLQALQNGDGQLAGQAWSIRQKPTGADDLTLGGSLSANVHGRGLRMKPLVDDIEYFRMVDCTGEELLVSRTENSELFQLAIGGYGLFGVVTSVALRLAPRVKLQRRVKIIQAAELIDCFKQHIDDGYVYGDFQFAIDDTSEDFLDRGIFAAYKPVSHETPIVTGQKALTIAEWKKLLVLTHTDKKRAYEEYAKHYLATDGQIYLSDRQQLSTYIEDYHGPLDKLLNTGIQATEIISELYVPRAHLKSFLQGAADILRGKVDVIYGTIRLIEREDETLLRWAKESYVCIIFNLHTPHSDDGLLKSRTAFRQLIRLAIELSGSFYLTYHKFADRSQVLACYSKFPDFLAAKKRIDRAGVFQSQWYRHYSQLFS
jgi:FAD/FMN-containing dehydrogenase